MMRTIFTIRRITATLAFACCLVISGCGPSETKVFPVTGSVTVKGKPAAGAQVIFHPVEGETSGTRANAIVGTDGTYTLTTRAQGDGAPIGDYKVLVTLREQIGLPDEGKTRSVLPEKYSKPELTPLTAKVVKGPNQIEPFVLSNR